jgi:hypothetical protein
MRSHLGPYHEVVADGAGVALYLLGEEALQSRCVDLRLLRAPGKPGFCFFLHNDSRANSRKQLPRVCFQLSVKLHPTKA